MLLLSILLYAFPEQPVSSSQGSHGQCFLGRRFLQSAKRPTDRKALSVATDAVLWLTILAVPVLLRKIPRHDDAGGNGKNSHVANGSHCDQSGFPIQRSRGRVPGQSEA